MNSPETPGRIEPARIEAPSVALADVIADLTAVTSVLGKTLHPLTAASLASLVRLMNTYYSNLIEGHNTRPRDIERAMVGDLDADEERRSLQLEAAAHVRVQAKIDRMSMGGTLPATTSVDFIRWIHREFYRDAPLSLLTVAGGGREIIMEPGAWRSTSHHDNAVGRHIPPSSAHVADFMSYFSRRFDLKPPGTASRMLAIATAHHRFNYIHPFPDGNGRVSRLMSHAMAQESGIGAHGLWSISRGLARGLKSRSEYMQMMNMADMPRQNDLDGRGNLSLKALSDFALWFLTICLDQARFMSELFELDSLKARLRRFVDKDGNFKPQAAWLLEEALLRGTFERGEAMRITGLPERTARRITSDLIAAGLLASSTEKGPVSLRFPETVLEDVFPRLFPKV